MVRNVDGISGSSDVVEISMNGSSVSYIVAGTDVDTSSSLCNGVEEASEGGIPISYAVVRTNVDRVCGSSDEVETAVETIAGAFSIAPLETSGDVTGTTAGDISCFPDAEEIEEILSGSLNVVDTSVIGIHVSSAVAETSVDGISLSCDFAETSVDDVVSVFVDAVETSVDTSSGLSLMSSSAGPLVLSITTDVSVLSIISAAKTCMRFQPVTFSISKAIAS